MVSEWIITPIYPNLQVGYNPFENLLPTSWDIPVVISYFWPMKKITGFLGANLIASATFKRRTLRPSELKTASESWLEQRKVAQFSPPNGGLMQFFLVI